MMRYQGNNFHNCLDAFNMNLNILKQFRGRRVSLYKVNWN